MDSTAFRFLFHYCSRRRHQDAYTGRTLKCSDLSFKPCTLYLRVFIDDPTEPYRIDSGLPYVSYILTFIVFIFDSSMAKYSAHFGVVWA